MNTYRRLFILVRLAGGLGLFRYNISETNIRRNLGKKPIMKINQDKLLEIYLEIPSLPPGDEWYDRCNIGWVGAPSYSKTFVGRELRKAGKTQLFRIKVLVNLDGIWQIWSLLSGEGLFIRIKNQSSHIDFCWLRWINLQAKMFRPHLISLFVLVMVAKIILIILI